MVFEEYLTKKNINTETFLWSDPAYFKELKILFNEMHPDSFTAQKKFLLNKLRRQYPVSTPTLL